MNERTGGENHRRSFWRQLGMCHKSFPPNGRRCVGATFSFISSPDVRNLKSLKKCDLYSLWFEVNWGSWLSAGNTKGMAEQSRGGFDSGLNHENWSGQMIVECFLWMLYGSLGESARAGSSQVLLRRTAWWVEAPNRRILSDTWGVEEDAKDHLMPGNYRWEIPDNGGGIAKNHKNAFERQP